MVNIHINGDKSFFKSKNSINRFKNKIKELGDPNLINPSDFLKEGCDFSFREEKDDIFAEILTQNYVKSEDVEVNDDSLHIHIVGDKSLFKSKNSVIKFKNKLRELRDPYLIVKTDFLQDGYEFKFKEEKNEIFAEIQKENFLWGDNRRSDINYKVEDNKPIDPKEEGRRKVKERLKYLREKRTGVHDREMHEVKKSVDKSLFKKYLTIKQNSPDIPIKKPNELLDNPEENKQEIQMFSSGMIEITKNPALDKMISEYYKEISEKVGYEVIDRNQLETMFNQMQNTQTPGNQEALPESINLNSYVDSDTESESSDVEDVEMDV